MIVNQRKVNLIKSLLILLSSMVLLMALLRHYFEGQSTSPTIILLYFVSAFFIGCYFFVTKYKRTEVVSFLIVFVGFLVTTIRALNTGGLSGSAITWFIGIPALAAFIQGHRWVIPWATLSILGMSLPLMSPEWVSGETSNIVSFIVLSLLLIVNSFMLYLFEKQRIENENRIVDQSKYLAQSEKIMSLSTLAGGVAHEINNPLAVIKGFSEQLKKKLNHTDIKEVSKEEIEKVCNKIENNVRRISTITQNLLVFTRAGQVKEFQVFEVSEIVESAKSSLEKNLSNIKFTLIHNSYGKKVEGNKILLEQVLINLISNSIDAISQTQDKWIQVEINSVQNELIISVVDSGLGIANSVVEKIFDPFFTTKETGKGKGLGLSLCKAVLEMHKGSLDYIKGSYNTKFVIRLPIKD